MLVGPPALFGLPAAGGAPASRSSGIVDSNPAAAATDPERYRRALVQSVMSWADDDGAVLAEQADCGEAVCPPYVLSGGLDLCSSPTGPRHIRKRERDASAGALIRVEEAPAGRRRVTAMDDESWRTRGWGTGQHSVWRKSAPKAAREAVAQTKALVVADPALASASAARTVTKKKNPGCQPALSGPELEAHRMSQRRKQVMFGKDTVGYTRYRDLVPRESRGKDDPQTPDFTDTKLSKRSFDGLVRQWRRALHKWDLPEDSPRRSRQSPRSTPERGPGREEGSPGLVEPCPFMDSDAEDEPRPLLLLGEGPAPPAAGDLVERQAAAQRWWRGVQQRACEVGTAQAETLGVHVRIAEKPAMELRELFRGQAAMIGGSASAGWAVSLRDPLHGGVIEVPARGLHCTHVQSFDLGALLRRPPAGPRFADASDGLPCVLFQCPVCDGPVKSSELMLDCFTGGVLLAAHLGAEGAADAFQFCPADGRWLVAGFQDWPALQGTPLWPG
eukprot:EG_transcript_7762